jgi:hypothetical protein
VDYVALRRRLAQRYLSDLQARVFEVALDAAHDLGADLTLVAQGQDRGPLRLEQFPALG